MHLVSFLCAYVVLELIETRESREEKYLNTEPGAEWAEISKIAPGSCSASGTST